MKRPNILLVMTDQQRRDSLSVNPGGWIRTPNIDRLAQAGVNYRRAYATCPICIPSRFTLLTGLHANRAAPRPGEIPGTFFHPLDNGGNVPDPEKTLPARLRRAGYATAVIGKTHMIPYYCPLGFDHSELMEMDPDDDYSRYLKQHGFDIADQRPNRGATGVRAYESPVPLEHYPSTWVTDRTIHYLEEQADVTSPFFLWCSYLRPHNPYNPPPPYHGSIDPKALPPPVAPPEAPLSCYKDQVATLGYDTMRPDETMASRARYAECVRLIDDSVGRIVDTLKQTGQWENTVILFTSDHGDSQGDLGLWHKATALETATGVPLVLRIPDRPGGRTSERLACLEDLAPTCLDLAGLPVPDAMDGTSLLASEDASPGPEREALLIECGFYPATVTAICTKRWKYIHHMNGGFEELYDRETDPEERYNLADSQADRAREMRAALVALIRKEGAPWYLQDGDLRAIPYDPRYNYYTGQRLPAPG